MIFSDHALSMTNEQIAASLDYHAIFTRSGLGRAVMQEAARRLRGDPDRISVTPKPQLKSLCDSRIAAGERMRASDWGYENLWEERSIRLPLIPFHYDGEPTMTNLASIPSPF